MDSPVQSAPAAATMPEPGVVWEEAGCPMCGSGRWSTLGDTAEFKFEDVRCRVVECADCGLSFTSPRPSADTIHRFYEDYPPHATCGLSRSRRRWAAGRLTRPKFWESYRPQRHGIAWHGRGRLLDFGCGDGAFLDLMHRKGWQVMGLDMCPTMVRRIRDELGIRALAGTLPHPELSGERFDVVTLWHSLEHVHRPVEVLRHVLRLLVPGGQLIVSVPNMASAPRRWSGADWFAWDLPRHLTHFTPETLKQMVQRAGFQVQRIRPLRNSSWTRSAGQIARSHRNDWRRLLAYRFFTRQVTNVLAWTGQSDEIMLTAVKPPASDGEDA